MARKPTKSSLPAKSPDSLLPTVRTSTLPSYCIADREIVPVQLFSNRERHPYGNGPWQGEADKFGWVDEATGLRCIILRQKDGTLSGYVGVEAAHPFHGFEADAIPSNAGIMVHGGITYARECEHNLRDERITVCHVTRLVRKGTRDVFEDNEDVWWFGFDTDHPCDFVPTPSRRDRPRKARPGRSEVGAVYRDQAYVYRECVRLAAQLSEIATGLPVPLPHDVACQLPPEGFRS